MRHVLLQFLITGIILLHGLPLRAMEGTGYIIERIEIKGNRKTKPDRILRSLRLKEGERLTPERVNASREALYRTRLFRTVHIASKPGVEVGKAVLVVYVDEKRFGDLGISVDYTELDGFGIAADAYHVNLWGEGKVVGGEYGLGERLKYWGFSYSDPWLATSGLSLHLRVSGSSSDRDIYRTKDPDARGRYDLERIGGSVGIGRTIFGGAYRAIFRCSFEEVQVGDVRLPTLHTVDNPFTWEVNASEGRTTVTFLGIDLYRRSAGGPWGSTPGTDISLQIDFSSSFLGSTGDFVRLRTEAYRHISTVGTQILSLGGRTGAIFGTPPFYERFFLDGPNQLRGFERRKIGPVGGAQFVSAEGVYSLSLKGLGRLYGFVEAVSIRRSINGLVQKDSDATFGVGILLFNRIDISFGIGTGTLIIKSHRFGGINVGL